MSNQVVSRVEVQAIRAAHEAATWYLRLEDGLSGAELQHYFHWLKESPENVEAMLYLEQFSQIAYH